MAGKPKPTSQIKQLLRLHQQSSSIKVSLRFAETGLAGVSIQV